MSEPSPEVARLLEDQTRIAAFLEAYEDTDERTDAVMELLEHAEELDNEVLFGTVLPFVVVALTEAPDEPGTRLFYALSAALCDFYDVSPKLSSGLQNALPALLGVRYGFCKLPCVLHLLLRNGRLGAPEALRRLLAAAGGVDAAAFVAAANADARRLGALAAALLLVLQCGVAGRAAEVDALLALATDARLASEAHFVELAAAAAAAFNDGAPGVDALLARLPAMLRAAAGGAPRRYRALTAGLLALRAAERPGLLGEPGVAEGLAALAGRPFALADDGDLLELRQLLKAARNCAMHAGFRAEGAAAAPLARLLTPCGRLLALEPAAERVQAQLAAQTAVSYVLALAAGGHLGRVAAAAGVPAAEAPGRCAEHLARSLGVALALRWEDPSDLDIATTYFCALLDAGKLDGFDEAMIGRLEAHLLALAPRAEPDDVEDE